MASVDRDTVVGLCDAAKAALVAGRHDEARRTFAEASQLSCDTLAVTDAARLEVAGAHADAWNDHWNDPEKALEIATTAYEDAIGEIDETGGEHRRAAVRELGQLRDRMTFWAFRIVSS
jgi:hypothetical protein